MNNLVLKNIILIINVYDYKIKLNSLKLKNKAECFNYLFSSIPCIALRDILGYTLSEESNNRIIDLPLFNSNYTVITKSFQDEIINVLIKYLTLINNEQLVNVESNIIGDDLKISIQFV